MAAELIGGREYYSDVRSLTSGTTNCVGGRVKGVFKDTAASCTFYFPNGEITFTPDANSIIPFAPLGISFASGNAWSLF